MCYGPPSTSMQVSSDNNSFWTEVNWLSARRQIELSTWNQYTQRAYLNLRVNGRPRCPIYTEGTPSGFETEVWYASAFIDTISVIGFFASLFFTHFCNFLLFSRYFVSIQSYLDAWVIVAWLYTLYDRRQEKIKFGVHHRIRWKKAFG